MTGRMWAALVVAVAASGYLDWRFDLFGGFSKRLPIAQVTLSHDPAVKLNNAAALKWRSDAGALDAENIIAMFKKAATSGLLRAELNLLLTTETCDANALEKLANRGDSRAASFAVDCLAKDTRWAGKRGGALLVSCSDRMLDLARIATSDDSAAEHMKFGWLLSDIEKGQGCDPGRAVDGRLIDAAGRHLLRAHELGVPAAAARIAWLVEKKPELVASLDVGPALLAKPFYEWLKMASDRGHPATKCALGYNLAKAIEEGPRPVDIDKVWTASKSLAACMNYEGRGKPIKTVGGTKIMDGQDGYDQIWKKDAAYLIRSPEHVDYNFDWRAFDKARNGFAILQPFYPRSG